MNLNQILKTEDELVQRGYTIKNNIIENIDVKLIAHFNNCCTLCIYCDSITPLCNYNNTQNLGFLLQAFYSLFDLGEEDGLYISKIKNIPCRLVFTGDGTWGDRCVGFGHFMSDKFVLTEEFVKIDC